MVHQVLFYVLLRFDSKKKGKKKDQIKVIHYSSSFQFFSMQKDLEISFK